MNSLKRAGRPSATEAGESLDAAAREHVGAAPAPPARLSVRTALAVSAVLAVVVAAFYKTIFLGAPIARIGLIAEWDSLFDQLRRGINMMIDPSAVQLALPTYTYIASQYHAGILPLWNGLNAFGAPLVGDIQATVFSPLRLVFNVLPGMYTYNLELIVQVMISAGATFAFARTLGATRLASVFGAIAYGLSPFILWYLELQSGVGFVLNPLVLWLFAYAARAGSARSAAIAGIASGATILTGHPETSFFAIIAGSILLCCMAVPQRGWISFAKSLAIAAISAFCVSAPGLLPFLEFAKHSDCYKYGIVESAFVPWQALLFNLMSPALGGASPFLGVLVPAFVPLAFMGHIGEEPEESGRRRRRSYGTAATYGTAVLALISLILTAKLFPFSLVAKQPPFNYVITVYCVPLFLLTVCALSALGLTQFLKTASQKRPYAQLVIVAVTLLVMAALPFCLHLSHFDLSAFNYDMTLPSLAFSPSAWRRDAIIAGVAVAAACLVALTKKKEATTVFACACIALNLVTIGATAKASLPPQQRFELPQLEVLNFVKRSDARVLACGTHLMKPDVNLLYGVDDVRSINAMLPERYVSFVSACGANTDQFSQWFPDRLTSTIDLGSVRYVLSQTPVTCHQDPPPQPVRFGLVRAFPLELVSGVTLTGGGIWSDLQNASAGGFINVMTSQNVSADRYRVLLVLKDAANNVVWFSDQLPIKNALEFTLPLPVENATSCTLSLKLLDTTTGKFVSSKSTGEIALTNIPTSSVSAVPPHFRFVKEFGSHIRVYENSGALPRAYIAYNAIHTKDKAESYEHIRRVDFNPRTTVVLEDAAEAQKAGGIYAAPTGDRGNIQAGNIQAVKIERRNSVETVLHYSSACHGYLVLTDTFYPGWVASIDGKRVNILRANYLFRAVQAPAGEHTVVFRYEPITFIAGVLLAFGFWLFVACSFIMSRVCKTKLNRLPDID